MSPTLTTVLDAALALPKSERAELIELIGESFVQDGPLHSEWAAELRHRAAEIDSGAVSPIPWEVARLEIEKDLGLGSNDD